MRRFSWVLAVFLLLTPVCAHSDGFTRAELRALWASCDAEPASPFFADAPDSLPPYAAGSLSQTALAGALSRLNALRALAGLAPVLANEELTDLAQCGALLCAANGAVSHTPSRPEGMGEELWRAGSLAASECNLGAFNWFSNELLTYSLDAFARDDGAGNAALLGHRRWLLNPEMGYTGFGLACDSEGRSYTAMYAVDDSADAAWDYVAWPPHGAFPAELMERDTPWSIVLNPAVYDLSSSSPLLTLTDADGVAQNFDFSSEAAGEGAFSLVSFASYGAGPALIFRPVTWTDYCQNQVWTVELSGLSLASGESAPAIAYTVEFASLTVVDPVTVELDAPESLRVGERAVLYAAVIPSWADDLSVVWSSSDPSVAEVDACGVVTAQKEGTAVLTATAANGRSDSAEIAVTRSAD